MSQLSTDADPTFQRFGFTGVANEFRAFLRLMAASQRVTGPAPGGDGGGGDTAAGGAGGGGGEEEVDEEAVRASPEEGARDLALVQAMLQSGAAGGELVEVAKVH